MVMPTPSFGPARHIEHVLTRHTHTSTNRLDMTCGANVGYQIATSGHPALHATAFEIDRIVVYACGSTRLRTGPAYAATADGGAMVGFVTDCTGKVRKAHGAAA